MNENKTFELSANISTIKQNLNQLKLLGRGINCVEKNTDRMLACLKMLELNINDIAEILKN